MTALPANTQTNVDPAGLEASFRVCRQVCAQARSSFWLPMILLPQEKRRATWALYAFLRTIDDACDAEMPAASKAAALAQLRDQLQASLAGHPPGGFWPALAQTVERYQIPAEYLQASMNGVAADLGTVRMQTWTDLNQYCYQVAGAVGLACLNIWGLKESPPAALPELCGAAFQLTNILRDLGSDLAEDRVYIPQEELAKFRLTADDLLAFARTRKQSQQFPAKSRGVKAEGGPQMPLSESPSPELDIHRLLAALCQRAEDWYTEAAAIFPYLEASAARSLGAMFAIYHLLLTHIAADPMQVFARKVRLPKWRKLWIVLAHATGLAKRPTFFVLPKELQAAAATGTGSDDSTAAAKLP